MMKRLAQLVALLMLAAPAYSTTYYLNLVANGASDSNNGLSPSTAWATFGHARTSLNPCDTLIVEPGHYYDYFLMNVPNLNGNASSSGCYTTIEAATPWTVIVDGGTQTVSQNGVFFWDAASYIQVIGIMAAGTGSPTATFSAGTLAPGTSPNGVLTVDASVTGTLYAGQLVWSAQAINGLTLVSQVSGTAGKAGTYNVTCGGACPTISPGIPMQSWTILAPWGIEGSNHIKLQQTAGYNAPCVFNTNVYSIGPSSSYILVEDSHSWGCGRYKFEVYQSDHVILRRDVARIDYHDMTGWTSGSPWSVAGWGRQCATFTNYDGSTNIFQNDIAIDSGLTDGETCKIYGGVWSEHNNGNVDNNIEVEGSVILNVQGLMSIQDLKDSGTHTFVNDAVWGNLGGVGIGVLVNNDAAPTATGCTIGASTATVTFTPAITLFTGQLVQFTGLTGSCAVLNNAGPQNGWFNSTTGDGLNDNTSATVTFSGTPGGPYSSGGAMNTIQGETLATTNISHMTIGDITGTTQDTSHPWGVGVQGNTAFAYYESQSVENNIMEDAHSCGAGDYVNTNYNYYYLNTSNFCATYYEGYVPTAGANDVQGTNPQLKYLTREEVGSPVYGTASDGGNIGATILYEIGTTGTLWGDTGYDTVTGTSLWPFPNEAQIKTDFASFYMVNPITSNVINGARGFAANGTGLYGGPITLTSYIWEYLGNACPGTICSGATAGGSAISGAVAGSVIQ